MKPLRALMFIALLVSAIFIAVPHAPTPDAQQGRALAQSGDFPFCVQFDSANDFRRVDCPTVTPLPTFTPTATNTPVVAATSTPTPEPTVTATPTATDTPAPDATPTPELTPLPTVAETPVPTKVCSLRAGEFNIRIRSGAGTGFSQVGLWEAGTERQFQAFQFASPYLWGQHATGGWSAVALVQGEVDWWVNGTQSSVLCPEVEGWPDGWQPPAPIAQAPLIVGLHVTNANRAALTTFQNAMINAGYESGTANYVQNSYCLDSIQAGHWCRQRWPPDHPDRIGGDDPEASARQYMDARNFAVRRLWADTGFSDRLIIELNNESPMEPYWWWNRWYLEAVRYAEANDWPQLALGGLGPGYGNFLMFQDLQPALMANHARGGYLSSHNYAPIEYCGGDGSLSNGNIYCAFRHRLNYEIITEQLGYDVRILITESSPTNGYQPVTAETLADIGRYTCMIQDDPGLHGVFFWNVGSFAPFQDANLGPYLPELARSISTCGNID